MRRWSVIGYPQPGKAKSENLLVAFVCGAAGYISRDPQLYQGSGAAFYGTVGLEELFRRARGRAAAAHGDFYYLDNAYFDVARQRYFRISRNALQKALPAAAFDRFAELGLELKPWRSSGRQIVVVQQSDYFMREIAGYPAGAEHWLDVVLRQLKENTDRPIVVRAWQRDKAKAASSLAQDLAGAWALVTHASAAANEALLAGVPVFVAGQSVAAELGSVNLASIEDPRMPDGREEWAARLAASQWRIDEMRAGKAWRALRQSEEARQ